MTNHPFVLLVLVIFSSSLNLFQYAVGQHFDSAREGEKVEGIRGTYGLVPYPRIGRNADFKSYPSHANLDDQDYEGFPSRGMNFKYADKILRDMAWLIPDHGHTLKEYRLAQRIDESRPFYSSGRGSRNTMSLNDYTPRLGREPDHELTSYYF